MSMGWIEMGNIVKGIRGRMKRLSLAHLEEESRQTSSVPRHTPAARALHTPRDQCDMACTHSTAPTSDV